ncbi:MAG: zinc-ribbon domain-containing protein, partial [Deltaproteobacteria bacterium]|nr:zinc-ribbon domain-containing protein [Deltaproteobacteria bacterium]
MKFSCNSCNTKYSLPDEKFAGKVITLTCKKCGSKIVVKPSAAQSEAASEKQEKRPSVSPPEAKESKDAVSATPSRRTESLKKPSEVKSASLSDQKVVVQKPVLREREQVKSVVMKKAPEAKKEEIRKEEVKEEQEEYREKKVIESVEQESQVWYYSRGGQQKGPFTDDEIRELVQNNVITPKTFIWKDGMMDWMKAGTAPEFSHFFSDEHGKKEKPKSAVEALGLEELDKKFSKEKLKQETEEEKSRGDSLQDDFFSREAEQNHEKSPETETD